MWPAYRPVFCLFSFEARYSGAVACRDVVQALEHIQNEGVTSFTGVPTMWLDLVSHPDYEKCAML
eukprot:COSAG01_NODE_659_length_14436_cov_15.108112_7_plen_65_part_00